MTLSAYCRVASRVSLAVLISFLAVGATYRVRALASSPAMFEQCAPTECIFDDTSLYSSAPNCGYYELWDLGWCDDDGCQPLWGDQGAAGEDEALTACNPTDQIWNPSEDAYEYELCQNQGTVSAPNWQCGIVDPSTATPEDPSFGFDDCGNLTWEYYSYEDAGKGGADPGSCATVGCTTTDTFYNMFAGEEADEAVGYCSD